MSQLTLKLKAAPATPVSLAALGPALTAGATKTAIERLEVAPGIVIADLFAVSGAPGPEVTIEGASKHLDGVGAGLASGTTLTVHGDVGNQAGADLKGGHLEIKGSAGDYAGSGVKSGLIHITGNAADFAGGVATGKRFGMTGGTIVIGGNAGARAGDKMRRGLILVRGTTGEAAGSRLIGGTIVAESGFGANPGELMRRGTLIGPRTGRLLPTFSDCGVHELVILAIMSRAWKRELGHLAPKPLPRTVRRLAGDLATIGKGEILLTG